MKRYKGPFALLSSIATVSAMAALSACGGAIDTDTDSDIGTGSKVDIAEAQKVMDLAEKGLVFSGEFAPGSADASSVQPGDFVDGAQWRGPTVPVPTKPGASLQLISCAAGTSCDITVGFLKEVATTLGWDVGVVTAANTPQTFATAFETAISRKPDAIVAVSIADEAVGAQLARARDAGIVTVGVSVLRASSDGYDAYVTNNTNMIFALNGMAALAAQQGETRAIVLRDNTYPNLDRGAQGVIGLLKGCDTCEVYTMNWTAAQGSNPVQAQQIMSAQLSAHPDANTIILPYDSIGLSAILSAIRQAGRADDITVIVKDATPDGLDALTNGDITYDATWDRRWAAYVAIDEVARGLAGLDYIPEESQGMPIRMFTQNNVPADAKVDFTEFVDYPSQYEKLWGID